MDDIKTFAKRNGAWYNKGDIERIGLPSESLFDKRKGSSKRKEREKCLYYSINAANAVSVLTNW